LRLLLEAAVALFDLSERVTWFFSVTMRAEDFLTEEEEIVFFATFVLRFLVEADFLAVADFVGLDFVVVL
jgi:hypothetical protein